MDHYHKNYLKIKIVKQQDARHYTVSPYILTGYRDSDSFSSCCKSVFAIHNETGNIWTHLIASLVYLYFLIYCWSTNFFHGEELSNKIIFTLGILSAVICYTFSSVYHTFKSLSMDSYKLLLSLDYAGIILVITGSTSSSIHFGYYCYPITKIIYIFFVFATGSLIIGNLVFPDTFKSFVASHILYTLYAGFGVLPLIHWTYLNGIYSQEVSIFFGE